MRPTSKIAGHWLAMIALAWCSSLGLAAEQEGAAPVPPFRFSAEQINAALQPGVQQPQTHQPARPRISPVATPIVGPPPLPQPGMANPHLNPHTKPHGSYHGGASTAPERVAARLPIDQPPSANTANIFPLPPGPRLSGDLYRQTDDEVHAKSWGCVTCHQNVGDMHDSPNVKLGCVDCHGGNANCLDKERAHVQPSFPNSWPTSGNPVRSYTLLNHESPEFIRFVNPGDLRVAQIACGSCHAREVLEVKKSMMTHGCMLWGAALYNNGAVPLKAPRYGESYSMHGAPQRMQNVWKPGEEQKMERDLAQKGMVLFLDPLPRFEVSQPGNILRIFEKGGRFRPEIGIPERDEEPGRPRTRLSNRGLGTENRTDPVFIGLQKTRLLDPTLNFLGTNDHPGEFRSSGCTACHVIYANDRSPTHSGPFAKYGHGGLAAGAPDDGPEELRFVKNVDPMIPKHEQGHPITHRFTNSIPTSQCIVCHIHPGTNVLNTYTGFMWWDNETDGHLMYPREQRKITAEESANLSQANPEEASHRGLWSNEDFLRRLPELNGLTTHTQFADFHGHGWAFRAVFKKDRKGNLLDPAGHMLLNPAPELLRAAVVQPYEIEPEHGPTLAQLKQQDGMPVHQMDIHLERGMHCSDCHFNQDSHGNTMLYGEVRAAIEITCVDCHGTANESVPERIDRTNRMATSGPAAPDQGTDLLLLRTPFKKRMPRFETQTVNRNGVPTRILIQRSVVDPDRTWEVVQTKDSITPNHPRYNVKSHMAKTVRWDGEGELTWGGAVDALETVGGEQCAHQFKNMNCITCHSSWNPSCFGCHLPQKANKKAPSLHNEGEVTRNLIAYNFQTLRDDVYMIARDGIATGNKINPARSSCAIHVTSYNNNRESIYHQQQTISGGGMSGIAFSTNVPHTVRGRSKNPGNLTAGTSETKMCSDCHLSEHDDNNAIIAQLMMHGTNYTNFIGKYCWVAAGEHGFEGVVVTETEEPQAVIGSSLHATAFPDFYKEHQEHEYELKHAHEHPGLDILTQLTKPHAKHEVQCIQARGEYMYAACGEGGLRVYDIAFIDHKGFSERITSAPFSPLGQQFYVPTCYATAVCAPTTIAPDPTRIQFEENHEQPVHGIYAYLYVTDKYEGLILVGAGTLLDGDPTNNFLKRDLTFNPNGILNGARSITFVGTYAYICCDAGLVVVNLEDPLKPKVTSVLGEDVFHYAVSVCAQFRYAFVADKHDGLKVLDITNIACPRYVAHLPLHEAYSVYVARTYAYVAGGKDGLIIVDVTKPEAPFVDQVYNANGCINDLHDVKLGITYTSEFAYLADGKNGLRVVQLTSPDTPGNAGFSPRPTPRLIATRTLPDEGHALYVAEGIDRDRAVDESGNQIAVFGRVGARPLNWNEQQRMVRKMRPEHGTRSGEIFKVSDNPFSPLYRRTRDVPEELLPPDRHTGPIQGPPPFRHSSLTEQGQRR